ncbi:MAG TPA: hypothetical protein VJT82_10980, partial [Pyrinomonadaceae bacterium]|nr:hypothetical protein [Pyrinomonadaceae bacterium]
MFNQLIESGSHKKDMARRGRFFLGTLGLYALLLMSAGVASVFAYDTHLTQQNLELYTLVAPPALQAEAERPNEPQHTAGGPRRNEIPQRVDAIARLLDNVRPPDTISTHSNTAAEVPKNRIFKIGAKDIDPKEGGGLDAPAGVRYLGNTGRNAVVVPVDPGDVPPPPKVTATPAPAQVPKRVSLPSSVISSKIITKPTPVYP